MKAFSILGQLPYFDPTWDIPYDYMHGICLGVTSTLLCLWFDTSFKNEDWYCGNYMLSIDKRLLEIKPITEITWKPRSLTDRGRWKGKICFDNLYFKRDQELKNEWTFYKRVLKKGNLNSIEKHSWILLHSCLKLYKFEPITLINLH